MTWSGNAVNFAISSVGDLAATTRAERARYLFAARVYAHAHTREQFN